MKTTKKSRTQHNKKDDSYFMQIALKEARTNIMRVRAPAGGPFGACIVRKGRLLAAGHNTVLRSDATAHAEVNAIRRASQKIKHYDLSGSVLYSTTEPCPMCFAAAHWAGIDRIVYGTSIRDVARRGFNELHLTNAHMKRVGKSAIRITRGVERNACLELLHAWDALAKKKIY